jgi:serine protease AprX
MTLTLNSKRHSVSALVALTLLCSMMAAAPHVVAEPLRALGENIDSALRSLATSQPDKAVSTIVSEVDPANDALERMVLTGGGSIERQLPIVGGFQAAFPAKLVPALASNPNLRSLSANRQGRFVDYTYDEATTASNGPKVTGATKLWSQGNHGQGVGVAVIDTGVSPMKDFTARGGRLIYGPDLSGENSLVDSYGHGTVMAGIIAGDGYDSANQAGGAQVGQAPRSWIVSVKVAGANGVTDVSTVLAAMHWVAAYRDQYNIRVVNLSWGTTSTQSYRYDPLNYAVERLWSLGITVVVAAGNSGPNGGTITKPGDDPFVVTVGAFNDAQNLDPADDSVPGWSSRGPTAADGIAKPDIVGPGRLIIATRSYGSTVEKTYPKALYSPSYIRGSGTSQAAAAVSGAAALLIQQKPHLSPAQVKYALMKTAKPISGVASSIQGAGRMDISAAAASTDEGYANLTTPPSNGLGSLEASRGGHHVQTDCDGDGIATVISGEITAQCQPWDGTTWSGTTWSGTTWSGTTWSGTTWSGTTWSGTTWSGTTWSGTTWSGTTWSGTTWSQGSWTGTTWSGTTWSDASWTGTTWSNATWTGTTWSGGTWTGTTWSGTTWSGTTWSGTTWSDMAWTTGQYDDWTTGNYDEFLTAFWGSKPPPGVRLAGEPYTPGGRRTA